MSVESELVTELLANAPLAALIGTRLAADKIDKSLGRPYVVYTVAREPVYLLSGDVCSTRYTLRFQCWGDTRASAEAVADALQAALQISAVQPGGIALVEEGGTPGREYIAEHELDLEGSELVAELWRDA